MASTAMGQGKFLPIAPQGGMKRLRPFSAVTRRHHLRRAQHKTERRPAPLPPPSALEDEAAGFILAQRHYINVDSHEKSNAENILFGGL
jgi:hypothetical protein